MRKTPMVIVDSQIPWRAAHLQILQIAFGETRSHIRSSGGLTTDCGNECDRIPLEKFGLK